MRMIPEPPPGGWPNRLAADLRIGLMFCTRLPICPAAAIQDGDLGRASWTFPLAGLVVGGAGALAYGIASRVGLQPLLAAALALTVTLGITGCLHEDGLVDTADGFGGGRTRARKLAIMRDSRIGTYGACALAMSLILRISAIAAIAHPGSVALALIAAHAAARAILPRFMRVFPPARPDGLSVLAGRPPAQSAAAALFLGIATLGLTLGPAATVTAVLLGTAVLFVMAWLTFWQIGGQTGDVLGALEQANEIAVLLVAAAFAKASP